MFNKKTSYVELEAKTPDQAAKVAGNDLNHSGETVPFNLTQTIHVDKVAVTRTGKIINVALGTDDGHFINLTISER